MTVSTYAPSYPCRVHQRVRQTCWRTLGPTVQSAVVSHSPLPPFLRGWRRTDRTMRRKILAPTCQVGGSAALLSRHKRQSADSSLRPGDHGRGCRRGASTTHSLSHRRISGRCLGATPKMKVDACAMRKDLIDEVQHVRELQYGSAVLFMKQTARDVMTGCGKREAKKKRPFGTLKNQTFVDDKNLEIFANCGSECWFKHVVFRSVGALPRVMLAFPHFVKCRVLLGHSRLLLLHISSLVVLLLFLLFGVGGSPVYPCLCLCVVHTCVVMQVRSFRCFTCTQRRISG